MFDKRKIIKGFFWTVIGEIIKPLLRFVISIIMARLLFPEYFGIIATAYIFIKFIYIIKEIGLSTAIIQRKDIDDEYLSSAFFVNIFIGFTLFIVTLFIAPLLARLFKNEILAPILRILSVTFFIDSFTYVHQAILEKKLDFRRAILPDLGGVVANGIIAIVFACMKFGIWSLVWSSLGQSLIVFLLFWFINPWRPKLCFNFMKFRRLFDFAINVLGVRVTRYIRDNADYFFIAKFLGSLLLGYYFMAYSIANFFFSKTASAVTRTLFPALSQMQGGTDIKYYFLKSIRYSALMIVPLCFGNVLMSKEFITFTYGFKWLNTVTPLKILSILVGLKFVSSVILSPSLFAIGKSDIAFKCGIFSCATNIFACILSVRYGIVGVAIAMAIAGFINFCLLFYFTNSLIDIKLREYLDSLYPIITASLIMSVFLSVLNLYKDTNPPLFIYKTITAVIVYFLSLKLTGINIIKEINTVCKLAVSNIMINDVTPHALFDSIANAKEFEAKKGASK